jgi:hypothetical protein
MKLLTFRRLKMKQVAESKNTDGHKAKPKDLTCITGWEDSESGYI